MRMRRGILWTVTYGKLITNPQNFTCSLQKERNKAEASLYSTTITSASSGFLFLSEVIFSLFHLLLTHKNTILRLYIIVILHGCVERVVKHIDHCSLFIPSQSHTFTHIQFKLLPPLCHPNKLSLTAQLVPGMHPCTHTNTKASLYRTVDSHSLRLQ